MPGRTIRRSWGFSACCAVAVLLGCGGEAGPDGRAGAGFGGIPAGASSAGEGGSVGGAGGTRAAGADQGGGGIVGCGTVVNAAPIITPTTSASAPPVASGGTLVSGTYVLSSLTFYLSGASCKPPDLRTSVVLNLVAGDATEGEVEEDTDQTTTLLKLQDSRDVFRYTVTGSSLMIDYVCTGTLSGFTRNAATPVPYSATPTEIRTFGAQASCGVSVSVFMRR